VNVNTTTLIRAFASVAGVVVALGPVGRNVGAGQTGGWGYFLEEGDDYKLDGRVNSDVQVQIKHAYLSIYIYIYISSFNMYLNTYTYNIYMCVIYKEGDDYKLEGRISG